MDYQRIYDSICARGKARPRPAICEIHHIIPRCLGGSNSKENLTALTPEEHYVVHQLLVKLYPKDRKLIFALRRMTTSDLSKPRNSNKFYGWLRRRAAIATAELMRGNKYALGLRHTPESRALMGAKSKGNQNARGYVHTSEARAAISKGLLGNTHTKGMKDTAETRAKRSIALMGNTNHRGKKASLETRTRMSISQIKAWKKRRANRVSPQ